MHFNKYIFVIIIVSIIVFSGYAIKNNSKNMNTQNDLKQNQYITIKGVASETKDGYYIGEYVLEHSEIQKYDADFAMSEYSDKDLEVVGTEKEVNMECGPHVQCRQGTYKAIYDIQSIKVIE
jgi:hypothetical protein